jgi:hypothetical protein
VCLRQVGDVAADFSHMIASVIWLKKTDGRGVGLTVSVEGSMCA